MEDATPKGHFPSFYRRHAEGVLGFFARRTYDAQTALDLTAETFAQAYSSRRRFRGATDEEAAGWLYAIARHQLGRYLRKGVAERRALSRLGVDVPSMTEEEHARVEELAGLADLRALVAEELERLSVDQRDALRLRVVEELPYPSIADRLGITEDTARMRVSRGLRALAAAVEGAS